MSLVPVPYSSFHALPAADLLIARLRSGSNQGKLAETKILTYSGTSDKGPSEIGTTSPEGTLCFNSMLITGCINLRDRDHLSTRDKIFGPIVPLVRRFHCIL